MSEVAMVVLSVAVGALGGVVTTAWKSRKDLEAQYDIDLRKRRIEAYSELWKTLEPLARHFGPTVVTHGAMQQLGRALRRWYFSTGGLVLSASTRPAYFNLQQALEGVTKAHEGAADELPEGALEILQALASRLRTSSTGDVATRVGPRLGPWLAARFARPWHRRTTPIRVTVDRRWKWAEGSPQLATFVIVENLTDRELTVSGVELSKGVKAESEQGETRFTLQPGEDREVSAVVTWANDRTIPEATRKIVAEDPRTPAVPLRSDLLGYDA